MPDTGQHLPDPPDGTSAAVPTTAEALARLDMPLLEAMMTQRAVRRVLPDPVDDALVLKCIELALRAPTGNDGQNWEFIVVKDRRVKEKLAKRYRQAWKIQSAWCCGARLPTTSRWPRSRAPCSGRSTTSPRSLSWWWPACASVPATDGLPFVRMPHVAESAYWGSIYPSVQNLLLAARAMGLGASLITLPLWSQTSARRVLNLPPPVLLAASCHSVGHAGDTARQPANRSSRWRIAMPTATGSGSTHTSDPPSEHPNWLGSDVTRDSACRAADSGPSTLAAEALHHDPVPHPVGQQQPSQHGGLSRRPNDVAGFGVFGLDRPDHRAGDRVGVDRQTGVSAIAPVISA